MPYEHSQLEPPLEVLDVVWLAASSEAVDVHVSGRWLVPQEPPARTTPAVLVIDEGDREQRFEQLARAPAETGDAQRDADDPDAWSARFSLPIELRPRLEAGVSLEIVGARLALPAAVAGPLGGEARPPGQLIDRAVLAERRARRAEVSEETLSRRASEADAQVGTLRAQLANLEERLAQGRSEREELELELEQRARDVRRTKQREYAEQQRRGELEEQLERTERDASSAIAELNERLRDAEQRADQHSAELESLRRQVAEAEHAAAAATRVLSARDEQLVAREAALTEGETSVAQSQARLRERLASVEDSERQLASLRDQVEAQRAELQAQITDFERSTSQLREAIEDERRLREVSDHALARERQLAAEHRRQSDALADGLRAELEQARARAEVDERRAEAAAAMLAELQSSATELRDELKRLEDRRRATEQDGHEQAQALAASERTIADLRAEAHGLTQLLAQEREQHIERERRLQDQFTAQVEHARSEAQAYSARSAELEGLVEELIDTATQMRERFDRERAETQADFQRRLAAERESFGSDLVTIEGRVAELREQLGATTEALRAELGVEQAARKRIELELSAERSPAGDPPEPDERAGAPAPEVPQPQARRTPEGLGSQSPAPAERPAHEHDEPVDSEHVIDDLELAAQRLRDSVVVEAPRAEANDAPEPDPAAANEQSPAEQARPAPWLSAFAEPGPPTPWLNAAIKRAAERDPRLAAELILALLPAQAKAADEQLIYELAIEGVGDYRVELRYGDAVIVPAGAERGPDALFRVKGSPATLAPLAVGPPGRRLKGAEVTGKRRRLRKLLRSRRQPLTLQRLASDAVEVSPRLLLTALAEAVDPEWTAGRRFTVVFALTAGEQDEVVDQVALEVHDGARVGERTPWLGVTATVTLPRTELLPLLAGEVAHERPPAVTGNANAVALLAQWFARAQGRA